MHPGGPDPQLSADHPAPEETGSSQSTAAIAITGIATAPSLCSARSCDSATAHLERQHRCSFETLLNRATGIRLMPSVKVAQIGIG